MLQVHDELIVESPEQDADRVRQLLKGEMERITPPPIAGIPVSFSVPLLVEANAARTWAEAH